MVAAVAGCGDGEGGVLERITEPAERPKAGRLEARPQAPVQGKAPIGLQTLDGRPPDGYLYAPPSYRERQPASFVLALHGAGGRGLAALERLQPYADDAGAIILAPISRGRTWDYILGGYGEDVDLIDRLLGFAFRRYRVDPARVGVEGFSDGASYALSLGLTNGDLFRHVVAFSPGTMDTDNPQGSPSFFITHGRDDPILPIDDTSRKIVPDLRERGYPVTFRPFAGKHEVPDELVGRAMSWLRAR